MASSSGCRAVVYMKSSLRSHYWLVTLAVLPFDGCPVDKQQAEPSQKSLCSVPPQRQQSRMHTGYTAITPSVQSAGMGGTTAAFTLSREPQKRELRLVNLVPGSRKSEGQFDHATCEFCCIVNVELIRRVDADVASRGTHSPLAVCLRLTG